RQMCIRDRGSFALNGFNAREADSAPRQILAIVGAGEHGQGVPAARPVRQEWWRPLTWAALALLVAEWLVQYRGGLVWLWGRASALVHRK
ncbi:MAG: hypothetical protein N2508_16625, partial [Anaerolineae bacterium]|nr:hypothetical protein [Anaerolineae bacterium]